LGFDCEIGHVVGGVREHAGRDLSVVTTSSLMNANAFREDRDNLHVMILPGLRHRAQTRQPLHLFHEQMKCTWPNHYSFAPADAVSSVAVPRIGGHMSVPLVRDTIES